jgi:hypothetical protein
MARAAVAIWLACSFSGSRDRKWRRVCVQVSQSSPLALTGDCRDESGGQGGKDGGLQPRGRRDTRGREESRVGGAVPEDGVARGRCGTGNVRRLHMASTTAIGAAAMEVGQRMVSAV